MKNYSLEFVVFVCGAAVMIFELIGSRLVGPYIGTSIYVWTSLIGVILASLSAGYYAGGWLADKNPHKIFLGNIIIISAILICLASVLKDAGSFFITMPLPIEVKSVFLSLLLFAPASFFLGMVSPYAVRLNIKSLETAGKDAGTLYALSTVGSIFGTFLAGFYIIPNFGSKTSLFLIAAALLLASVVLVGKAVVKNVTTLLLLSIAIFTIIFYGFLQDKNLPAPLMADIDTQYNRVLVYESQDLNTKKPITVFSTDPFGIQAAVFSDGSEDLVFNYTKFFRLAGYFNPNIKKALMLGGCVYTYPRDFIKNFKGATMDIVEIDPAMTQIAKDYFHFTESPRLSIFYQDARVFLNENNKKYDVIFKDVFNSNPSIPFQLTTQESIQKEADALTNEGMVLVNIISSIDGDKGKFLRAEYATYKKIFPQVFVFLVTDKLNPERFQNIMLVAVKSNKTFDFKTNNKEFGEYLSHLWKGPIMNDMPVLTDDFSPAEYYQRKSI